MQNSITQIRTYLKCTLVVLLLTTLSCQKEIEQSTLVAKEINTTLVANDLVRDPYFAELFKVSAKMSRQVREGQLKVKVSNQKNAENIIASSKSDQQLNDNLSLFFSNPATVIAAAKELSDVLTKLDSRIHFSELTVNQRQEVFAKALNTSMSKQMISELYMISPPSARIANCGGNCNNVYYHTIEAAAATLATAAAGAGVAGFFGGPAGMAAGAAGIISAVITYYIVENYALVALGDCFDTCYA
ncbi:hypothetical protein ACO2Q8_09605 [Larkinella sp. VNQ87]|uniref:hypothetical protein n=1 Tax=Larkinella sp. VNQ87 TaxID=3400921 RepID=UPI003BFEE32A